MKTKVPVAEEQIPSLPMKVTVKGNKLIIEYGKYNCKFKTIGDKDVYSGLLVTKFLWQVTKELWDAHYQRSQDIADVKKSLLGIKDTEADNLVRKIHEDLFGEQ